MTREPLSYDRSPGEQMRVRDAWHDASCPAGRGCPHRSAHANDTHSLRVGHVVLALIRALHRELVRDHSDEECLRTYGAGARPAAEALVDVIEDVVEWI